jgi:hypothetical protein
MIAVLPQLAGGCINYWEAGNWALHRDADPVGPKTAPEHRRVHTHLLGRSRFARDPDHEWGEAPRFPMFHDRHAWAAGRNRLTAEECMAVVGHAEAILAGKFGMTVDKVRRCDDCGYPRITRHDCAEAEE